MANAELLVTLPSNLLKNEVIFVMKPGNITISVYENSVPSFLGPELERLYGHIYSSLAHHGIYSDIAHNTSTYFVRENGTVLAILLFRVEKNSVRVLNEQIKIGANEINRFAHYIFGAMPSVMRISFHAIHTRLQRFAFPYQQADCTEDIVLTLPDTVAAYLASLGKSTRRNVKYYMNKLKRDFPSLRHDIYLKDEVSEQQLHAIFALNRLRMTSKSKVSCFDDDDEAQRLIKLVKLRGLTSVISINGHVCAGTICLQIGPNYFAPVCAHEAEYDNYSLGLLCWYLTICNCIERGGREFHFLWGRYEYKSALLGSLRTLDHVEIYRSRLQFLLNANSALKLARDAHVRKASLWLQQLAKQHGNSSIVSRVLYRGLHGLRSLKNFAIGFVAYKKYY